MDGSVLKYLSERIPRYTSYPTAPHFSPAVGANLYANWLQALPEDARLSLYLHVPFCRSLRAIDAAPPRRAMSGASSPVRPISKRTTSSARMRRFSSAGVSSATTSP